VKVVRVLDQAGGALFSLGKDGKRDEQIRRKGKMITGPGGGIHFIFFGNSLLDSRFWGFVWREQATSTQDLYNLDSACSN
jgi:hypothetical protein